jgi:hypothetical protein
MSVWVATRLPSVNRMFQTSHFDPGCFQQLVVRSWELQPFPQRVTAVWLLQLKAVHS